MTGSTFSATGTPLSLQLSPVCYVKYAWDFGYKMIEGIKTITMPQSSQVGVSCMNH